MGIRQVVVSSLSLGAYKYFLLDISLNLLKASSNYTGYLVARGYHFSIVIIYTPLLQEISVFTIVLPHSPRQTIGYIFENMAPMT